MDPFTLGLIGAGIGGLFSKNHLKGALLGGLGGYAGGALMPGLLGGGAAAGEAAGSAASGAAWATPGELAASGYTAPHSAAGLLEQAGDLGSTAMGKLEAANKALKPVGQAIGAANMVSGLLASPPPIQTPAPNVGGAGGNAQFQALQQQQAALEQQRMQEEMQRREAQQKLLAMMGGSYGRTA